MVPCSGQDFNKKPNYMGLPSSRPAPPPPQDMIPATCGRHVRFHVFVLTKDIITIFISPTGMKVKLRHGGGGGGEQERTWFLGFHWVLRFFSCRSKVVF